MIDHPYFSIVMPIYNVAPYLEKSILSILKQTYRNFELILVNDSSTDSSLAICRKYEENKKVKLINLRKNGGVSNARNSGLEVSCGEYILFLDPDDYVENDLLEKYEQNIIKYKPDLLIIGTSEEYIGNTGRIEFSKKILPDNSLINNKKDIYSEVLSLERKSLYGYPWNKCYKTNLLKQNNIFFKKIKMIEDIQFNLELLPYLRTIQTIDISPYHYAIRQNGSLTHQHLADYFQLHTTRIQLFLEEYERNMPELLEACKQTMAPIYCRYLLSAIARYDKPDLKHWLSQVFDSSLFQRLYPYMRFTGKKKWIYGPIRSKNAVLCIVAGKSAGFVKEKLPSLFAKAKQTR